MFRSWIRGAIFACLYGNLPKDSAVDTMGWGRLCACAARATTIFLYAKGASSSDNHSRLRAEASRACATNQYMRLMGRGAAIGPAGSPHVDARQRLGRRSFQDDLVGRGVRWWLPLRPAPSPSDTAAFMLPDRPFPKAT